MKPLSLFLVASSLTLASLAHAQEPTSQPSTAQPLPPLPSSAPSPDAQPAPLPATPAPTTAPAPAPRPAAPPPPVMEAPPPEEADADAQGVDGATPPSTGFQLALRTGYSIPMGSASGAPGDDLSATVGGQVPLIADIGFKPTPNVFVGGYIGLGFGGVGSSPAISGPCSQSGVSCLSADFRIGLQVHYHFSPDRMIDPWIGYGLGVDSVGVSASGPGGDFSSSIAGFDFAHLMLGFDYRASQTFGIGPMIDMSFGEYSKIHTESRGTTTDEDIQNTATHEWLMLGVRGVFFP